MTPAAESWARLSPAALAGLLDELIGRMWDVTPEWVAAACAAKRIPVDDPLAGEEWLAGPMAVLRAMRLLRATLGDVDAGGAPRMPAAPRSRPGGQLTAQVFPTSRRDALLGRGLTADAWMDPALALEDLPSHVATARPPGVALVLGAGNVSSIPALDVLYKLFAERRAVVLKLSPVNDYLAPLIERAFRPLIAPGYLRIEPDEMIGRGLVADPEIDEIHITGSDATYDAIVFGAGAEGQRRKARGERILRKPVTAELGCVMPVIVAPGQWSAAELAWQGEHLATMIVNNAGFNCVAARVIVTWAEWPQREALLEAVRNALQRAPTRYAYYPGAQQRFDTFLAAHPEGERFGRPADGELPWVLISGLDPAADDELCFHSESFCGVAAEAPLHAASPAAFLDAAAGFANDRLWGSLAASIVARPGTVGVDRAAARLRYGFVGVNLWAGVAYALGSIPWGAYPGHQPGDIQSGAGVVHNTYMLDRTEKTVARGPFRPRLTPAWSHVNRRAHRLGRRLCALEAEQGLRHLGPLAVEALRG